MDSSWVKFFLSAIVVMITTANERAKIAPIINGIFGIFFISMLPALLFGAITFYLQFFHLKLYEASGQCGQFSIKR